MAEQREFVIQVRAGVGEPPAMPTVAGEAMGPISVGHSGTWRVVALGVRDEHAFLYFDGSTLYVQSIDDDNPAFVNSAPIQREWTSVESGSEIQLGDARLWYGPLEEGQLNASDGNASGFRPDRPFPPGEFVNEDSVRRLERPFTPPPPKEKEDTGVTRFGPIEEKAAAAKIPPPEVPRAADMPRPAAGVPARGGGTVQMAALPVALARSAPPGLVVAGGAANATMQAPMVPPMGAPMAGGPMGHPAGAPGPMAPAHLAMTPMGGSPMAPPGMGAPMGGAAPGLMLPQVGPTAPTPVPPAMPVTTIGPIMPPPNMGVPQGVQPGMPMAPPSYPGAAPEMGGMAMTGPPGAGATTQPGTPSAAAKKPSLLEQAKAQWNAAPPPRKAIIVLALPVLVSVYFLFIPEDPPPKPRPKPASTAASTGPQAPASATPTDSAQLPTTAAASATGAVPAASATSALPAASASAAPTSSAATAAASATPAETAAPAPRPRDPRDPKDKKDGQKKTLQRAAADAVAAGAWADAATLYEQLARVNPEQPAYAEAARIMRQKAAGK